MCGGTDAIKMPVRRSAGLSPRVRGNLKRHLSSVKMKRSIPACAGEPERLRVNGIRATVYPRVCGGTNYILMDFRDQTGLSPRVRGNLGYGNDRVARRGSIPACAGEPQARRDGLPADPVYPRVCGGTQFYSRNKPTLSGLSPRVRGNPPAESRQSPPPRSIPACAGEPPPALFDRHFGWVYPRVCGGTVSVDFVFQRPEGLSPRVRGNRDMDAPTVDGSRSIPACAGEPRRWNSMCQISQVYPRVCGGTRSWARESAAYIGLSPRVRGNLQAAETLSKGRRSIPACAGEPSAYCSAWASVRVYPRVCGGTPKSASDAFVDRGLSPRVRGNLPVPYHRF